MTTMPDSTFKYVVEGIFMTTVSIFGLVCNSLSIYILHDKNVKLKRDFVQPLCAMSVYDNLFLICAFFLFSLPQLSDKFGRETFTYTAPYLYPITNTFMTCSSYMTVAVAVNRCLGIVSANSGRSIPRIKNGYIQAFIVLLVSVSVNIPRWLEFSCCNYRTVMSNITDEETGIVSTVNSTRVLPIINPIRNNYKYIRDYTLISSNVLTLLLPMIFMLISAVVIYNEMSKTSNVTCGVFSDAEEAAIRKRYQRVTFMLIGIIILFIVCRVGELAIATYELIMIVQYEERQNFPEYIRAIVSINNLLLVCNSSMNFVIYCKDVFFRQCLLRLAHALRGKKQSTTANRTEAIVMTNV